MSFIRRAAHQPQRLLDLRFGENVEEGRLGQLNRQRLLQSVIKDGIAGPVVEVGQDDPCLSPSAAVA